MRTNRTFLIVIFTLLFLIFGVIYHIWANWGLITIHANKMPLGKVIASMERQGHATIQTDIPLDVPVTMDIVRYTLPNALETLSTDTNSRWRMLFFVAGDKATLKQGESSWFGGQRPDGWRMVSFPMGGMFGGVLASDDEDAAPPDPRNDVWTPQTPAPAPVQTFFKEAAELTNAGFAFPETWNPTVKSMLHPGRVTKVVSKLVSYAGGKYDEVFFLSLNGRGGGGGYRGGGGDNGPNTADDDFRPDPNLLAERTQNEINQLPPDQKAQAQQNFNTWKAFWQSLQGMTDDQRREAIEQRMQDPQVQDQIQNMQDGREGRMNHDERMQHFANYVNRKMSITGRP